MMKIALIGHAFGRFRVGLVWLCFLLLASGCAGLPGGVERTPSKAIARSTETALGKLASESSSDPDLSGFRLIPSGAFALSTRIELARRAQRSLDVQYYHIQNDETGRYLLRLMRDAGQRGVRVRLLIDDLYTSGEDDLLLGLAATPNVEIRLFNPFTAGRNSITQRFATSLFDIKRVIHRMHNKLFIADGAMAVAGGRNIGNEYFMRNAVENFIDIDTFATGAIVPTLSGLFDQFWNSERTYPLEAIVSGSRSRQELRDLFEQSTGSRDTPPPMPPPPNDALGYSPLADDLNAGKLALIWAPATAYADSPDRAIGKTASYGLVPLLDVDSVHYNFIEQIRRARQEVAIFSPYLIPGQVGLAAIRASRKRGVKFTVITNSLAASDVPVVHTGYRRYRPALLGMGVELYELSPTRVGRSIRMGIFGQSVASLHAKSAVIDGSVLFIGSMNFDPRSESLNTELGLIIQSPLLAQQTLKLMNLVKQQGTYHLRLSEDGSGGIEWQAGPGEELLTSEPDAGFWRRLYLELLAPLAPESQL
jgi:cardiolipin synthase C